MKGGHLDCRQAQEPCDLLLDERGGKSSRPRWSRGVNSHGSGCTFSAAIAAGLARGRRLRVAVAEAKAFISLRAGPLPRPAPGNQVIDHFFSRR